MSGRFVTFEGIEGTGKTTQLERLAQRLEREGSDVVRTREPGATAFGRELRALLLRPTDAPMSPTAELLLYVADRAEHLRRVVEPALARGAIVLCDRFSDATLAYQGYGRGLGVELVRSLHRHDPLDLLPDRTVLLRLDPEVALQAITSIPADLLGVSERLGTLAPGRDADMVVLSGDPLAFTTRVKSVMIDGEFYDDRGKSDE